MSIYKKIADELKISTVQVTKAVELLDEGATVPFISRYRKEITGGLDDTQLRNLEERLHYLRDLEDRRQTILKSIKEQDKLTAELEKRILEIDNKAQLEDLYLPYKPKRRTKAQIAKEAGLEPLALTLLQKPTQHPDKLANEFINEEKGILNVEQALEGAQHILIELFSENADLLTELRNFVWQFGILKSEVVKGKEIEGNKFSDYFAYSEALHKIPSHRALALLRGQREEFLFLDILLDESQEKLCIEKIANCFNVIVNDRPADQWLFETVRRTWRVKLFTKFHIDSIMRLREDAEAEAINVFANNLKHLLMASPAGSQVTLGLDPGLRTGVKVVVVDGTGKLLSHCVIYPHAPRNQWQESIAILAKLCKLHNVKLVSIGNGTASRETDQLVSALKKAHPELNLTSIVVSEAGASVYSASELAAKEFPDLDVSYRGSVSIARRLQDPLAELVKIDPKSIGVGQYQHDVNQIKLARCLRAVMEDCVNAVGVDVNTASVPLLSCVAGINEAVASNIVSYRESNGAFKNRMQLKSVPRLGEKAFEQAAGFLRIANGDNPLDTSAVHPEAYLVVQRILKKLNKDIKTVMNDSSMVKSLNPREFIDESFGVPTVVDILSELEKPGRDPRPEFKTAAFKEGVETIEDLKVGMLLEGVITNVANFGAFVDIGVHQDGLVHISNLTNRFIKNPHEVVKVGDIVKVKILEVDTVRKRIQLTMKLDDSASLRHGKKEIRQPKIKDKPSANPTMESLFRKALTK